MRPKKHVSNAKIGVLAALALIGPRRGKILDE
jgi:hypothetical protein